MSSLEELEAYFENNSLDGFRLCIVIACPAPEIRQQHLFVRVVYISGIQFDRIVTRFPLLLDGEYYCSKPSIVADGLFIGQLNHAKEYDLSKLGIHTIINMTPSKLSLDKLITTIPDLKYFHFPLVDSYYQVIRKTVLEVEQVIAKCPKNCLVFCHQGMSRSGSMVLYYLAQKYQFDNIHECLQVIQYHYPKIKPNDNFMTQLEELLRGQQQRQPQQ